MKVSTYYFMRKWFTSPFIASEPYDHSFNPERCQCFSECSILLSGECSLIVFCFILCLFTHCALLGMTENPKPCSARGAAGTYEVLVV